MVNEIAIRTTVSTDTDSSLFLSTELVIDGRSLTEHFNGNRMQSELVFGLPYFARYATPAKAPEELVNARKSMGEEYLDWSGYSALTLNADGFPHSKIPILACCLEEIDGYFACSMAIKGNEVVWHDFGFIEPDWENVPWFKNYTSMGFTPANSYPELRFRLTDYRAALEIILRDPQDNDLTEPIRRQAKKYRNKAFARMRGFTFPREFRVRVVDALMASDPLDLRRYGEVDLQVYAGLPRGFWSSQFKTFQADPIGCLIQGLESAYGLEVSEEAVNEAVARLR